MAVPRHLQIINPCYGDKDVIFFQFQRFPKEIRDSIWEYSLKQYRIIEVTIQGSWPSEPGDPPLYSTTNALNKIISGRNYKACIMQRFQLFSKLLRINSESRQVALRFYRVHISCYLPISKKQDEIERTEKTIKTVLYFNPEYDFINLKSHERNNSGDATFVHFLYDFKAHDPKNVGILNLALDRNDMTRLLFFENLSEAPAKANFVYFLSHLQQIIWIAQSHYGRCILGEWQSFRGVGVQLNHSMPIRPVMPTFELLSHDPRPVDLDLQYVVTSATDPRSCRKAWQQLLKRWEIRQVQPSRERVLFAYKIPIYLKQICDVETANEFLKKEEEDWNRGLRDWHQGLVLGPNVKDKTQIEGPEELAKVARPAIGFWLFPVEALGELKGELDDMKKVFDMRGYRPELALCRLS